MSAQSLRSTPPDPDVTIVMMCRERFRLTESAIETLMRSTDRPFRLIYADVNSPAWLRERLDRLADAFSFELLRFDEPLWPSQVRRRIAPMITSKYAVFMDNDVIVWPGWLERLQECADETGAGIVGPLYLWGETGQTDRIHMAGGELREEIESGGVVLREKHRAYNKKIGEVALARTECGFVEFHCMMMRREIFAAPETFDEEIVCVHEHIHASLVARTLGYKTYVEPAARVTYLSDAPYSLTDLDIFRWRWSAEAGERSIQAFAKRWNVIDGERSFGVRQFLTFHRSQVDPVRRSLSDPSDARAPMRQGDLKQNLSELLELAQTKGYSGTDLDLIKASHWNATLLSNCGYRPCGRPFLNHLVGTASVLVHFRFEMRLVVAGLLHAAYTHAPRLPGDPKSVLDVIARSLGGHNSIMDRQVRAYTLRAARWRELCGREDWQPAATIADIDAAILAMANMVDMHLSGEVRATGRTDAEDAAALVKAPEICQRIGVPGLAATMAELPLREQPKPVEGSRTASFRIEGGKMVSMRNPVFFQVYRNPVLTPAPITEPTAGKESPHA
jgi:GT2 family glycosyltransferase